MNLIELITLILILATCVSLGSVFGNSFSGIGWVVGIALGVILCGLVYGLLSYVIRILHKRYPLRPECRQGKCKADDYELLDVAIDGGTFVCRCGDKYVRKGNKFMRLDANGIPLAYMKRRSRFAPWEVDTGRESSV